MTATPSELELRDVPPGPFQAVVTDVRADGLIEVRPLDPDADRVLCELVLGPDGAPWLTPGIRVLVAPPPGDLEYATIIGRIGRASQAKPREINLEAGEQITLRCGKGSVTLRADGKVIVKGVEIVSTAQRRNRVKGGSVDIN
jgi:hypothetical protein